MPRQDSHCSRCTPLRSYVRMVAWHLGQRRTFVVGSVTLPFFPVPATDVTPTRPLVRKVADFLRRQSASRKAATNPAHTLTRSFASASGNVRPGSASRLAAIDTTAARATASSAAQQAGSAVVPLSGRSAGPPAAQYASRKRRNSSSRTTSRARSAASRAKSHTNAPVPRSSTSARRHPAPLGATSWPRCQSPWTTATGPGAGPPPRTHAGRVHQAAPTIVAASGAPPLWAAEGVPAATGRLRPDARVRRRRATRPAPSLHAMPPYAAGPGASPPPPRAPATGPRRPWPRTATPTASGRPPRSAEDRAASTARRPAPTPPRPRAALAASQDPYRRRGP